MYLPPVMHVGHCAPRKHQKARHDSSGTAAWRDCQADDSEKGTRLDVPYSFARINGNGHSEKYQYNRLLITNM
jgi:hypothetical protein